MHINRESFLAGGAAALLAGCAGGGAALPTTASAGASSASNARALFPALPLPVHPIIGEVRRFDGKRPPNSWMICDGRALPIDAYEPLYAVLGQSAAPRNPRTGRLLHGNPTHFYLPESGPLQFVIAVRGVAPTSPRVVNAVMAERRDQNPV